MLEIPESNTIAKQINETIKGKTISFAAANQSPHKFAWYFGDPKGYNELLAGKQIGISKAPGGMGETEVGDCRILFSDGAAVRYYDDLAKLPKKHQLFIEFEDRTALVSVIQMYGGLNVYRDGDNQNEYYIAAKEKISPLCDDFDLDYFCSLKNEKVLKLSAKAFLATEQRIPGLGNGVLQDILFTARIHPKRKMADISNDECKKLYEALKSVLKKMTKTTEEIPRRIYLADLVVTLPCLAKIHY
jgi:formamidopyrimidine-DNA glycosylase